MQKNKLWLITLTLVIGTMIMIFLFSGENAELSSEKSSTFAEYFITTLGKLLPAIEQGQSALLPVDFLENIIRKCAHFLEYALLSFFVNFHFFVGELLYIAGDCPWKNTKKESEVTKRAHAALPGMSRPVLRCLCAIMFCVLYAGTDELHQFFVPGRACRLFDVGIDTMGAIFGMLLFLTLPKQKVTM